MAVNYPVPNMLQIIMPLRTDVPNSVEKPT